jgi:hypothetical protein
MINWEDIIGRSMNADHTSTRAIERGGEGGRTCWRQRPSLAHVIHRQATGVTRVRIEDREERTSVDQRNKRGSGAHGVFKESQRMGRTA